MAETELDRAQKRYEQAKARLQALRNREAARTRKIDTRRKVILGGALMDLAGRDTNAAAMLDRLIRNLPREQDRDLPPSGPSFITRVCGFEIGSRVGSSGQARRARSLQVAQAFGALRAASGSRARNAA